jgi:hypothetical protein
MVKGWPEQFSTAGGNTSNAKYGGPYQRNS